MSSSQSNNEEKEDIFAETPSKSILEQEQEEQDLNPFTPTATATSNPTSNPGSNLKPASYTNSDPFANVDDDEVEEEVEIEVKPKPVKPKTVKKPTAKPKAKKEDLPPITNDKNLSVPEAINEFYALKSKYETINFNKYIKPILKSTDSKREKKSAYSKLPKFPCVNCKRNVNTIFKISYDVKDGTRTFTAKCGDIQDPCPLNIEINKTATYNAKEHINQYIKKIDDIKFNIIKEKNNALFFKNPQAIIQKFEELTNELKQEAEFYGSIVEENLLKNDNPVRAKILNESLIEFNQGLLLPFKEMIKDFIKSGDETIVNNAIVFYKNEMMPKLKEIQELKYDINYVEYYEPDKTYHLTQIKNSPEKGEYNFYSGTQVVSFIRGIKGKTTNAPDASRSKTLKIKPSLILAPDTNNKNTRKQRFSDEEDEGEDKQEQEDESEKQEEQESEEETGVDF